MADVTDITATGKSVDALHCLTIPLHEETVLLPNAAIAEVVAYIAPEPVADAPEWFLGFFSWRDKRVPLISFEAVSGRAVIPPKKNSRIAVLNTLNGNTQLPYIGVLSQGIPSLALVHEQGLEDKGGGDKDRQYIAANIKLGGIEALIPNIDEIEQRLIRLHF